MTNTVLIVDDIDANLYLLRTILTHNDYIVTEAKNGKEALEVALESLPDLIISDILMPVMDGFSLCKAWRENETLKNIPFIFYTATYTEKKDAEFALGLGADRFLIKPMNGNEIIEEVVTALSNKESTERPLVNEYTESLLNSSDNFYKVYNSRLIHKLEDKLLELETKNNELIKKENEVRQLNDSLEIQVKSRTKELLLLNEDLESFNYSVSHDLRAPLRAILGFSEVLLEDYSATLDREVVRDINRIHLASERMDAIINSLLRLSKIKKGELKISTVNLTVIAEDIVSKLVEASDRKHVEFQIQHEVYSDCDEDMLQIALENLLNNAWKYTSKNTQSLIEFGCKIENSNPVYYVKDNGAGFNPEYADSLFKPFRRLHTQYEFEGIGIGLATTKRIINHHNGNIWAEGKQDGGACFYFTLNSNL